MNTLWAIIHHPFAERVGWILLHSLWQGALIGAGFALLRLALRKQSTQARYLAGCVCLILMLAAPLLTLLAGPAAMKEPSSGFPQFAMATPSATAQEIAAAPVGSSENWFLCAIQSAAIFLGEAAPWLTAAWLCGIAFSSCKLMRGFWWVQTIRKKEINAVNPDLLECLDSLRRRLLITRPVRLLKSALVEVPTVVGWLRPVILLPASSLAGLTPGQLEAILVHELAHVRRFDYLVNIFQCLIETVMFYHPVVWWISRCIREEREHCCDDLVVKVCGNRVAYARALATLEGLRVEMPQLAFAASGGSLLNRVRRLLGATGTEESMSFRQIGGLALLGVGLVFILLGIYLNLQKPMYRAAALIKVAPETTAQIGAENGKITLTMSDPYLTQNVFEEIQSGPVLTKVVEDLGLDNEWGKRYNLVESPHRTAEIIALLKGKIGFRPIRNTMFLEIGCLSENPEEAKEIVNSVARAYQQFRLEQLKRGSLGTLKVLEERWKEQEDQVRKAQSEVDRLREEHNIPDMRTGEPTTAMLMSAETLRKLEGMRIELESQAMRDENLFATYKGLPREKLLNVLPTTAPDPLLNSLLEQRTFCEQALIVKRHDFGAEHLEVVKLKTQLENLQSKINDRLDGVLLGIEGRLKSEREQLTKLKDEVETAKARDIAAIKETQPYWEAKRKLEDLQRFSQVLAMKVASESVEASLPKKMLVEIMNDALTPRRPIYPNRFQAAAMIVLGILLDLAGLRLIRARPHLLTPVLQPS